MNGTFFACESRGVMKPWNQFPLRGRENKNALKNAEYFFFISNFFLKNKIPKANTEFPFAFHLTNAFLH
jgi:hypothetical protein